MSGRLKSNLLNIPVIARIVVFNNIMTIAKVTTTITREVSRDNTVMGSIDTTTSTTEDLTTTMITSTIVEGTKTVSRISIVNTLTIIVVEAVISTTTIKETSTTNSKTLTGKTTRGEITSIETSTRAICAGAMEGLTSIAKTTSTNMVLSKAIRANNSTTTILISVMGIVTTEIQTGLTVLGADLMNEIQI